MTSQSDSTRVPPVTALRSPPLSRITGALSPVMALSSTEATPSITSPSAGNDVAGLDQHEVALAQRGGRRPRSTADALVARLAQLLGRRRPARALRSAVGLRLAAPFGHRLGEVGEQHREPEPERRLARMNPAGASPWPSRAWTPQQPWSAGCRPRRRTSPGCEPGGAGRACETSRPRRRMHRSGGSNSRLSFRVLAA